MKKPTTKMRNLPIPELTEDELVLEKDYRRGGEYISRSAIIAYVENDEPIPNELKNILYGLLEGDFKRKKKSVTASSWRIIVMEITWLRLGINPWETDEPDLVEGEDIDHLHSETMTISEAVEIVADRHSSNIETVTSVYNRSKYKPLKDAITESLR